MGLRLYGLPEASSQSIMPHAESSSSQTNPKPQEQHIERSQEQRRQSQPQSERYRYRPSSSTSTTTTDAPDVLDGGISAPAPVSSLAVSLTTTLDEVHQRFLQTFSRASQPRGAGANTGAGVTRPKTEAELEADRLYEEAMEDEYAKRDGGC